MTEEDEIYEAFDHANKFKTGVLTGQKILVAVKANNAEELKRLMNLPVDEGGLIILRLTQKDSNGKSALQLATESNNEQIIEILRGQNQ